MPQIAQQEYLKIVPKEARSIKNDAECLRRLKAACLNGTIFDCIVKLGSAFSRALAIEESAVGIDIWDYDNSEYATISVPYSVKQYSGLAAVQSAEEEITGVTDEIPALADTDGYLTEDNEGFLICCDDYKIIVTLDDDDVIEALEKSDVKATESENHINVPFDKIEDLIGLPIV